MSSQTAALFTLLKKASLTHPVDKWIKTQQSFVTTLLRKGEIYMFSNY